MVICQEPGSNPPDARCTPHHHHNTELPIAAQSKQGGTSLDSDSSLNSAGASTRKGLRQHLAEVTDSIMQQATSVLKKEHRSEAICAGTDTNSKQFDYVPVFDKSIDYFAKVREQSTLLKQMQGLHEDHSVDFLSMLKESVRA